LNGSLVVGNLGIIAPGSGTTTGTLTVSNHLTLGGSTVLKLNTAGSPTSDEVICPTIAGGGVLTVTNVGPALTAGTTFQLFSTSASGFSSVSLPVSDHGLTYTWTTNLAANGSITLASASSGSLSGLKFTVAPVVSGTSLSFSATNSGSGTVYLLTSTNLSTPIGLWTPIWTNVLGGSGTITTNLSNAVKAGAAQQFYILSNTNN
jgi:hypothetical protein